MRARGLTLLETLIAATIVAFLAIAAFSIVDTGSSIYSDEGSRKLAQSQIEKIVDTIAEDYRTSAAWDYFKVSHPGGIPGTTGDSVTRLTKWFAGVQKTRGATPNDGTAPFAWPPVRSDLNEAVAFLKIVGHEAYASTSGYPAYLVLDFEPRGFGGVSGDAGANGSAPQDNQPGRQDDDQARQFILYRTNTIAGRIIVERVRGVASITNDGSDSGTVGMASGLLAEPVSVVAIGDLGPARLPAGVTPGRIEIEAFDTNGPTGAGAIRIRALARSLRTHGNQVEAVTSDIETQVAVSGGAPPF